VAFNLMLPIPSYGDYSLELLVDGEQKKSITLTAVQMPVSAGA
jgi:hypothetical protein